MDDVLSYEVGQMDEAISRIEQGLTDYAHQSLLDQVAVTDLLLDLRSNLIFTRLSMEAFAKDNAFVLT